MKVRIDHSVFADATDEARQLELSFLLHIIVYKHRYDLKVTDPEVLACDSYTHLTQTEQDIIAQELSYSLMASATAADCEVTIGGEIEESAKVFSPSEAIIYLLQPLSLILENGLNDSHFIKALFRWFDTTGELHRRINEGWVRFENAGGCSNVGNFLLSRIKTYGDKQKFLHCYVVLDGDRRYPTDPEPAKKYKTLKSKMTKWNVGYHILEKRCMENYMPEDAMASFPGNQEWMEAYRGLTEEQKDCLSIAEGFSTDISKEQKAKVRQRESKLLTKDKSLRKVSYVRGYLPAEEQTFYATVSRGNFLHLEKGLKVTCFKTKFPEKFGDSTVTYRANLLSRTSHQADPRELEHIVGEIRALI